MISAFASAALRLLPGRELARAPVEELREVERLGDLLDAGLQPRHAVELAENRKILAHGQPLRQIRIGAFEIDPVEHLAALARHVGAEYPDRPGGRGREAHDHRQGGGLAGAIAAKQADDASRLDAKAQRVHGGCAIVGLAQIIG